MLNAIQQGIETPVAAAHWLLQYVKFLLIKLIMSSLVEIFKVQALIIICLKLLSKLIFN